MEIKGKNFLILGLGKTGIAAIHFILKRDGIVIGVDDLFFEKLPLKKNLLEKNVPVFSSQDLHLIDWNKINFLIASPGIAPDHSVIREAQKRNIKCFGELEFASYFSNSPLIAITGTNGKSTTTELVGAIFREAKLNVSVGGNLGTPWLQLIDENPNPEWTILEVSSFQLETIEKFHPQIAVILNITDDHFDRHKNIHEYALAKAKIFLNQTEKDFIIYNKNDVHILKTISVAKSNKIPFSSTETTEGIFWRSTDIIESQLSKNKKEYSLKKATLHGLHNIENMMAAIAVAETAGIAQEVIQKTLENFRSLPHRLEFVRDLNGVRYFDDSKGTNIGAVAMSLASFNDPVVLILGGKDKGGDYGVLRSLIRNKVKTLVLIGEAKQKIKEAFDGIVPIEEASSMQEAVYISHHLAENGDIVLLSPACSSFDMFRDYKHRGDEFQKYVKEL